MTLRQYILENYNGRNNLFAEANGIKQQSVSVMIQKGTYHVYNGMLVIERRAVK